MTSAGSKMLSVKFSYLAMEAAGETTAASNATGSPASETAAAGI